MSPTKETPEERRVNCDKCCVPLNIVKGRLRLITWVSATLLVAAISMQIWPINRLLAFENNQGKVDTEQTQRILSLEKSHNEMMKKMESQSVKLDTILGQVNKLAGYLEGRETRNNN